MTLTRANTVTAWGQLEAGKAQVKSAQAQVTASEVALNGVREEAKAGQRTTLDVLNAQQALVNARVALVTAQHDRVVASYAVLNSIGRLSPQVLQPGHHDLRSERALPAGPRQLGWHSYTRRPLKAPAEGGKHGGPATRMLSQKGRVYAPLRQGLLYPRTVFDLADLLGQAMWGLHNPEPTNSSCRVATSILTPSFLAS